MINAIPKEESMIVINVTPKEEPVINAIPKEDVRKHGGRRQEGKQGPSTTVQSCLCLYVRPLVRLSDCRQSADFIALF